MSEFVSQLTERHRWLPFVLPFAVYSILGQFEPQPQGLDASPANGAVIETVQGADSQHGFALSLDSYPFYYAIRIAITGGVALLFWSSYTPTPIRIHRLSWLVGIIGVVVWIGLCQLDWESAMLAAIGQSTMGVRPSFDPFTQFGGSPTALVAFLAIRFLGHSICWTIVRCAVDRGVLPPWIRNAVFPRCRMVEDTHWDRNTGSRGNWHRLCCHQPPGGSDRCCMLVFFGDLVGREAPEHLGWNRRSCNDEFLARRLYLGHQGLDALVSLVTLPPPSKALLYRPDPGVE